MDRTPLGEALEEAAAQVRANRGLRDLLRVARAWGVPPSRVLGGRTVDVVVECDPAGRPIRHVTLPWDVSDVAFALALEQVEAGTCDGCGHPLAETTNPLNEGRYKADLPVRCHACTELAAAAEPYRQNPHPQALRFPVRLRPPVPVQSLPPIDGDAGRV